MIISTLDASYGRLQGCAGQDLNHGHSFLTVTHALRADDFDASEDGTGRGTPLVPIAFSNRLGKVNPATETLRSDCNGAIPMIAFSSKDHGADAGEIAPTLRSMEFDKSHANGGGQVAIAIQERAISENPNAGPDGAGFRDDGNAYTLEARTVPQAVAFNLRGREDGSQAEPTDLASVRAASGGSSRTYVGMAIGIDEEQNADVEMIGCLKAREHGGGSVMTPAMAVRRLTPMECERLQGVPDGFTLVPRNGKTMKDSPRYKMIGNGFAVPVVRWIGERIEAIA